MIMFPFYLLEKQGQAGGVPLASLQGLTKQKPVATSPRQLFTFFFFFLFWAPELSFSLNKNLHRNLPTRSSKDHVLNIKLTKVIVKFFFGIVFLRFRAKFRKI